MHQFLKEVPCGEGFEGFYLCKGYALQKKNDGKEYFRVDVADKSGQVHGVCWEEPSRFDVTHKSIGTIVHLKGTMGEYRDVPQIRIFAIREATEADKADYDAGDIVESAPIDETMAAQEVAEMIDTIADDEYRLVAKTVFTAIEPKFTTIPAGKTVHHSFRGGLLMHTWNMMKMACNVAELYESVIDRSLLLSATFLHDIAKIQEFDLSELGLVKDYSKPGQLLGHLYMGAVEVQKICEKLNVSAEKSLLLQHMILSHHGELDKGAVVQPKCAEAEALHIIDLLDSRLEIYAEECEQLELGQFTPKKNWALEHRIFRSK